MNKEQQLRQLVNNPMLDEVLTSIEVEAVNAWKISKSVEEREDCYKTVVTVGRIKNKIKNSLIAISKKV
jgi:hypothetical protein